MKRKLSMILAVVMLTGAIVGCGNNDSAGSNSGTDSGSGSTADSNSTADTGNAGGSGDTTDAGDGTLPTITMLVPSYFGGEMDDSRANVDQIIAAYEDYIGVSVDWTFSASDAYGDTFNLTLMDRANIPMVMAATGSISGTVIQAAQQGAFWDLTPFLESGDYPYLSQAPENVYEMLTVNGQIIGIPKLRNTGRYGFSYRKDWAEAVGITKAPSTPDEVYDLLYAFTYNDPDGNGVDDTYGMESVGEYTGWMDIIMTWFGCGYGWVEKDGDLVPVHETEEYKEALDWLKKVYDDGLIRRDFVTVQTSDWGQAVQRGEAGSIVDCLDSAGRRAWLYYINNDVASVVNPDEIASMELVGPINGRTAAVQVYNGYFLITKDGAKTEEDVKNCLKFLDQMNSVEMRALADYGIEGLTYEIGEDGGAVMHEDLEQANYPHQGLNQAVGYIPFILEGAVGATKTEPYIACDEAMALSAKAAVFNPAEQYLTTSDANANYGTILAQTISDARTQYITGAIDWDGFQAAVATWESQGGAQMKQEVNDSYHAQ